MTAHTIPERCRDNGITLTLRHEPVAADPLTVRRIVESTDYFRPYEVDVAVELVEERLAKGEASGYHFVFAEIAERTAGYACYGPIACTVGSFDLFWIAVDKEFQRQGLGAILLRESERLIRLLGGRHIYIETSGRPQYAPTRAFYERCGYRVVAVLPDYYDVADDKVIFRADCGNSHSTLT